MPLESQIGKAVLARLRHARPLAIGLSALLALGACGELASPTVPGPSPREPGAGVGSPRVSPSPQVTPQPTPPPWPAGWADDFCLAFNEVAIAQELAVDIPRAIEDEDEDDALALASELRETSGTAEQLLAEVPEWEPAQPAVEAMEHLVDIGGRIGRQWIRFLDDGRRGGRTRARELGEEMQPVVAQANEALADLAGQGLSCPSHALVLESP